MRKRHRNRKGGGGGDWKKERGMSRGSGKMLLTLEEYIEQSAHSHIH